MLNLTSETAAYQAQLERHRAGQSLDLEVDELAQLDEDLQKAYDQMMLAWLQETVR